MKIPTRIFKNIGGVATIEMALVLPLLLFVLMGFFSCAHLFWMRSTMENALVATGRFAIVNAAADARMKDEFNSNIFGMNSDELIFTSAYTQDQGIHYETFSATRRIPLLNVFSSFNNVLLQAQITVPPAAGIFDCAQQNSLMNTARGYILRIQNDTQNTVRLFSLDDDGNKTLYLRLKAGESQMSANPIQNGHPLIVTDDNELCLEIIVPWRPTSNFIISRAEQ